MSAFGLSNQRAKRFRRPILSMPTILYKTTASQTNGFNSIVNTMFADGLAPLGAGVAAGTIYKTQAPYLAAMGFLLCVL